MVRKIRWMVRRREMYRTFVGHFIYIYIYIIYYIHLKLRIGSCHSGSGKGVRPIQMEHRESTGEQRGSKGEHYGAVQECST